jgi:DegV family protein with EDD domain
MSNAGATGNEIVTALERRRPDLQVYLALETLEYLKRGGRISGTQAAIGTLLSVKPIIEIKDSRVETTERVRTRGKARERLVELLAVRPIERLSILHTTQADVEGFAEQLIPKIPGGIDRSKVTIDLVGPSVGPHLGPGCVGAVALYVEGTSAV